MDTALDAVGWTPLVRLNRIPQEEGLECEILAKCEFFNAGGSVKDRIGKRMVLEAEKSGRIKPGDTLIEPTSGNTGIGIALAAAVRGYRCIITMPEKMSQEKVDVLKALGAEIVRTPTEAAFDSPESHISVAERLNREIPNSHILDQYTNPHNPLAHYEGTAVELIEQAGGPVDMVVMGTGTGGTLTGIARKLKEVWPNVKVVGVDPKGSILAEPAAMNEEGKLEGYLVEGTGYDFIPTVLDRELVDTWVKTTDEESFMTSRRLIRSEGLLCGGSSGGTLSAGIRAAKAAGLGKGQRVIVLLADSIRNYLSKFVNNDWMWSHGFVDTSRGIGAADSKYSADLWWTTASVRDLAFSTPFTILPEVTAEEAVGILAGEGFDQLPVVSADNEILGVVTEGNLRSKLMLGRLQSSDPVTEAMFKQFKRVSSETPLKDLARIFDHDHFALVVTSQRVFGAGGAATEKSIVSGVVSRIDLLKFLAEKRPATAAAGSEGAAPPTAAE